MMATIPNGYNIAGCNLEDKNGRVLTQDDLRNFTCCQCSCIIRDGCQLSCGDRICRLCVPSTPFDCKSCQTRVDPTEKEGFFVDRRCQRDLKEIVVLCKCSEKLHLDPWEAHSDVCPALNKDKPQQSTKDKSQILQKIRSVETDLKGEIKEVRKSVAQCTKKTESLENEVKAIKTAVEDMKKMAEAGAGISSGVGGASRHSSQDIQRISVKLSQLNEVMTQLVTDVEQHKGTIAQMSTNVDSISSSIPQYDTKLEELNLKIEILEVKTCTGIYVWKVNELGRRTREARVGRTLSLYSPPFYTSPHGYRVCLRAYLNGDGTGRGTHVSLYIVIMKSEYDDLLTWPFAHEVTLSLINQVNPMNLERSITHRFSPNADSSSFQKPQDTFNIASGFPEFAPVSVLNDPTYCRNDTIYFRIKLDPPNRPTGPDQMQLR